MKIVSGNKAVPPIKGLLDVLYSHFYALNTGREFPALHAKDFGLSVIHLKEKNAVISLSKPHKSQTTGSSISNM